MPVVEETPPLTSMGYADPEAQKRITQLEEEIRLLRDDRIELLRSLGMEFRNLEVVRRRIEDLIETRRNA